MSEAIPHFLLFSGADEESEPGRWRFVLRAADGSDRLMAEDVEPDVQGERLQLLALVRGLEALGQPSRVTLITPSSYVRRGVRSGLSQWRRNGWRWECFGRLVAVKDCDLWQRVDRALGFHELECRNFRFDRAHQVFPIRPAAREHAAVGWHAPKRRLSRLGASPGSSHHETVASAKTANATVASAKTANATVASAKTADVAAARATRRSERHSDGAGRWHLVAGFGKLSRIVRLFTKNRLGELSPMAVCKEV